MVIFAIILPVLISIVLQISAVQNFVVDKMAGWLSKTAGTEISIGRVDIEFFTKAVLGDVLMRDHASDTLIYAKSVNVGINGINFITGKIALGTVTLTGGQVNIRSDSMGVMNISKAFEGFESDEVNPNPPNFRLSAAELNVINTSFSIDYFNAKHSDYGVNWENFKFSPIDIKASDISVVNYNIWLKLDHLNLRERSGFSVNHLSSKRCGVDSSGMYFADVELQTAGSNMELDSVNFLTTNRSWFDWNDFGNKMILSVKVNPSMVDSRTLEYLIGLRMARKVEFNLAGATLFGPLSNMRGLISGVGFDQTSLDLKYAVSGLPNIDKTYFDVELKNLSTISTDIERVYSLATGGTLGGILPILERCHTITMDGSFSGFIKDFKSRITLNSSTAGTIVGSFQMSPSRDSSFAMVANLATEKFDAGAILGLEKLKRTSLRATMQASGGGGRRMKLSTQGEISSLEYGIYDFNSIKINGNLLAAGFQGNVSSNDPNLTFWTNGLLDMSGATPRYDFELDLERADLAITGLNNRDSVSVLSAHADIEGVGKTIDDMNGLGEISNIIYISPTDTVRTGSIYLSSRNTNELKEVKINSDFADIELRGRNSFSEIFRYLSNSLQRFLPSFPDVTHIVTGAKQGVAKVGKLKDVTFADGYYQFTIDVKNADNIADIFVPGLEIANGSKLNFFFNPYIDQFSLRATSDYILTNSMEIDKMELDSRNHSDSLSMFLTADNFFAGGFNMPNFSVMGGIRNNVITLGGRFVDNENKINILLRTTTTFERTASGAPQMNVRLHPTPITLSDNAWTLAPANILLDTSGVEVRNFALYFAGESLEVNGRLGRGDRDTMTINVHSFDMSPASALVSSLGYKIRGSVGGEIKLVSFFGDPKLFAAIDCKNVYLNDFDLGNPKLRSTFDQQNYQINFALGENLLAPPIQGFYSLRSKTWGGDIKFRNFDMKMIEPVLSGILSSTEGRANVDLKLRGKGSLPSLSGSVDVLNYNATVDFTRVAYSLSGLVEVEDNRFTLPSTPFKDNTGGGGTISAFFDSDHFKNLRFGVNANFTDLLALNTTIKNNTSFYGKAWGTGRLSIDGTQDKTAIVIAAQTAGNSQFNLPLSTASTIESADFIRFVNPKADSIKATRQSAAHSRRSLAAASPQSSNELDIKINLGVLPNTLAQIEFDAKIGDVIKGRGQGGLSLHINPSQNIFDMTGSVEITQGNYLFTLFTVFQRRFVVNPGATITWTGNPADPLINLSASYRVKTSLSSIANGQEGKNTMANIDCSILLAGNMQSPDISFDITAPSADPETQNLIRNSINTQEMLSMQFLSLLLSNSFMPDMGASAIGTIGGSFAGVTGVEFLSNQLSQMLSSDKVNVRLAYRMQTTSSAEEYSAGVGTDLIQDVLSFEVDGNYTNGAGTSVNPRTPFTMDAYLTWNVNKRKTLKLQGFTRTIDRFDETQGLQESGVVLSFRQNFNNLKDLKARLAQEFARKDRAERDSLKKQRIEKRRK